MSTDNSAIYAALIGAAASGVGAYASSKANSKKQKADEQLARDQMAATKALGDQRVAADESSLDPFRQQMSQATDISKLDRLERGTYKPVSLTAAPGYDKYVPTMTGGFSYEKSPDLISSAAALKHNVMGGNVAPTMTNPANYGKTATLNLVKMAADGVDPATVNAGASAMPTAAPAAPTDYLAGAERRGGGTGGVVKGAMTGASMGSMVPGVGTAIGAGVGAIVGAATKHAKTAPTDVDVSTARNILTTAIQKELGRAPGPGEVDQLLAAQGLKPGDRWVGQGGLTGLINTIQSHAASLQPSYVGVG